MNENILILQSMIFLKLEIILDILPVCIQKKIQICLEEHYFWLSLGLKLNYKKQKYFSY